MVVKRKFRVSALCVTVVVLCVEFASGEPTLRGDNFDNFWANFREAILQREWQKVEQLTRFPLTVRGVLDKDPVRRVGRREFPKIFERFLKQGVFSPNEQLECIRRTTAVSPAASSADVWRVGDMIFKKTANGWRLDTLYMDTLAE